MSAPIREDDSDRPSPAKPVRGAARSKALQLLCSSGWHLNGIASPGVSPQASAARRPRAPLPSSPPPPSPLPSPPQVEKATAEEAPPPPPQSSNPIVRGFNKVMEIVNHTAVQTTLYIVFVYVFQTLAETVRQPKLEFYFDKMIQDTFVENHFDGSHNAFSDVRRLADIWEWGNNVLWPGFFANAGPCGDVGNRNGIKTCNDDAWPDGEGSFHMDGATPFSIPELVKWMDLNDWTDGVIIKTARVAGTSPETCSTQQLSGVCYPELLPAGSARWCHSPSARFEDRAPSASLERLKARGAAYDPWSAAAAA